MSDQVYRLAQLLNAWQSSAPVMDHDHPPGVLPTGMPALVAAFTSTLL